MSSLINNSYLCTDPMDDEIKFLCIFARSYSVIFFQFGYFRLNLRLGVKKRNFIYASLLLIAYLIPQPHTFVFSISFANS